jgi:8-oxo-dGTP pyrophosphatase MutT (NUDIX family)
MELNTIRKNLEARTAGDNPPGGMTPAAVLFPLFRKNGEVHILFTKRTETVRAHKGQISFPGGVREPGDESLLTTALREAHEEIGLLPSDVDIMGSLEPVPTVTSGFLIYTYVGLIPYPYSFQLNNHEVAEILTVPFDFLTNPKNWSPGFSNSSPGLGGACAVPFGGHVIWGATARILNVFFQRNGIVLS